jgi:uncharacterized protein
MQPQQSRPWRVTLMLVFSLLVTACGDRAPMRESPVTDQANVLHTADRDRIAAMIENYRRETSHEIAVLIVSSLEGEGIGSLALRVANRWRLGEPGRDNGILVVIAVDERQVRIEPGRGFRRFISAHDAQGIVELHMAPAFRKGDYAGGLERGLGEVMKLARRYVVEPQVERQW